MGARLLRGAVATVVIAVALLLGAWFAFSALSGATLITFRTGSMSPTMPQGALAVSLPTAASDVKVGEVVTVQRGAGELPVTHRVVEVRTPAQASSEAPLAQDQRELVLQGEDNDAVHFAPYVVDRVRRVAFAMPGAGAVLMLLQSPLGMGMLTLFAGAMTAWAFWPARSRPGAGAPEATSTAPSAPVEAGIP